VAIRAGLLSKVRVRLARQIGASLSEAHSLARFLVVDARLSVTGTSVGCSRATRPDIAEPTGLRCDDFQVSDSASRIPDGSNPRQHFRRHRNFG
jgi:hypothetical protein